MTPVWEVPEDFGLGQTSAPVEVPLELKITATAKKVGVLPQEALRLKTEGQRTTKAAYCKNCFTKRGCFNGELNSVFLNVRYFSINSILCQERKKNILIYFLYAYSGMIWYSITWSHSQLRLAVLNMFLATKSDKNTFLGVNVSVLMLR